MYQIRRGGELFTPASGTQLVIGTPPSLIGDPCDVRSTSRTGANGAQVAALCVAQGVPAAAVGSYTFPTTATCQTIAGKLNLTPEKADTYPFKQAVIPISTLWPIARRPWARSTRSRCAMGA